MFNTLKEFVFAVDMLTITDDDFKIIFDGFVSIASLLPAGGTRGVPERASDVVDKYMSDMSRVKDKCSRRTDDSKMAQDFAACVVGACCLVAERVIPDKALAASVDLIGTRDEHTKAEVSWYWVRVSHLSAFVLARGCRVVLRA